LGFATSGIAAAPLREGACGPLRVVDRFGRLVRELPAACGHRRHGTWLALGEMPELLPAIVIASEDRRFASHLGVDLRAMARALLQNARGGRARSGASTLSMQLMRMLHQAGEPHTLAGKLEQMWLAFALERRLDKREILEAYLNHAYYGAGAYGVAQAAREYFDKAPRALRDGESALLAVLSRAPSEYDPRRHLDRALARRGVVLQRMVELGLLSESRKRSLEAEPIAIAPARAPSAAPAVATAGHFVDWVLGGVPASERRKGGMLRTTLDLELQAKLEYAVAEHVARMASAGIEQAGVVVLDSASGEVRAMVGSSGYQHAQLNITTRRRRLGSLLKPFAYGLAIERGDSPASVALDVGDVPSDYHARDWVGREAGPLSYREALAGSYNLAAVHVLERVGVPELHARLRRAGVAELPAPAARYGLELALGSARVRLLDVVAGYASLVRDGLVRRAQGVVALVNERGATWRPNETGELRVFAPGVSWLVLDTLSDQAARHRRFGRGLPLDGNAAIAGKTGTASGMSDVSTILVSREFSVGAWAGRFDGAPSHGTSGMWGAAPLARRALEIALSGRAPSLPARPSDVVSVEVCAESGLLASSACPRAQTFALAATLPREHCTLPHAAVAAQPAPELAAWASRARALAMRSPRGTR
jgi:penicillin-binding protein 1C